MQCTLGIDYGTNSVRALVVRVTDGRELGSCVVKYPSGREGVLLDTKDHLLARQHPGDYLTGLAKSVRGALAQAGKTRGFSPGDVVGIGVDSTGSSPIPVDAGNRALAVLPKWRKNLHAQCWLWKDHTAWRGSGDHASRGNPASAIHRQMREHVFFRMVLEQDLAMQAGRSGCFRCGLLVGGIG